MTKLFMGIFATGWCAFWAGVLFESLKYADNSMWVIVGIAGIFLGWLTMLQVVRDM